MLLELILPVFDGDFDALLDLHEQLKKKQNKAEMATPRKPSD